MPNFIEIEETFCGLTDIWDRLLLGRLCQIVDLKMARTFPLNWLIAGPCRKQLPPTMCSLRCHHMLIIASPSLRTTNYPWKGRGHCHVN